MIPFLGQYRIIRELGRGGQGSVYLAEDTKLGRRVALKVLNGVPQLSPRSVERFRREAEITAQIDHPGICTTYDFGNDEGTSWIAMRYIEGETLAAKIAAARGPAASGPTEKHWSFAEEAAAASSSPSPTASSCPAPTASPSSQSTSRSREEIAWVVRVIEQAARALHVAHEQGVIHRDIKPANIMVAPDDTPVILDFGLANVVEGTGPDAHDDRRADGDARTTSRRSSSRGRRSRSTAGPTSTRSESRSTRHSRSRGRSTLPPGSASTRRSSPRTRRIRTA